MFDCNLILLDRKESLTINGKALGPTAFASQFYFLKPQQESFMLKDFLSANYRFCVKYSIADLGHKKEALYHEVTPARLGMRACGW